MFSVNMIMFSIQLRNLGSAVNFERPSSMYANTSFILLVMDSQPMAWTLVYPLVPMFILPCLLFEFCHKVFTHYARQF